MEEVTMVTKRVILAAVVVFVVAGALIHRVWLGSTYQAMRDSGFSFRTPESHSTPTLADLAG